MGFRSKLVHDETKQNNTLHKLYYLVASTNHSLDLFVPEQRAFGPHNLYKKRLQYANAIHAISFQAAAEDEREETSYVYYLLLNQ